jgi:hypothetical protein
MSSWVAPVGLRRAQLGRIQLPIKVNYTCDLNETTAIAISSWDDNHPGPEATFAYVRLKEVRLTQTAGRIISHWFRGCCDPGNRFLMTRQIPVLPLTDDRPGMMRDIPPRFPSNPATWL